MQTDFCSIIHDYCARLRHCLPTMLHRSTKISFHLHAIVEKVSFVFVAPGIVLSFGEERREEAGEVLLNRTSLRCFGSGILIFNRRRSLKYCRRFALRNSEASERRINVSWRNVCRMTGILRKSRFTAPCRMKSTYTPQCTPPTKIYKSTRKHASMSPTGMSNTSRRALSEKMIHGLMFTKLAKKSIPRFARGSRLWSCNWRATQKRPLSILNKKIVIAFNKLT